MNIICWVTKTNSVSTPGPKQQVALFLFRPIKEAEPPSEVAHVLNKNETLE